MAERNQGNPADIVESIVMARPEGSRPWKESEQDRIAQAVRESREGVAYCDLMQQIGDIASSHDEARRNWVEKMNA